MKQSQRLLSLLLLVAALPLQALEVASPDGSIRVSFELQGTVPTYSVSYQGKAVILPSRLGYDLDGTSDLLDGFSLIGEERSTFDETWTPVWGENREIHNHYNELLVCLAQTAEDRYMNVRFRVYDDGFGLRYEFPQKGKLDYFVVSEERTEFAGRPYSLVDTW